MAIAEMKSTPKKDSLKAFATFLIWFGIVGMFCWALAKSLGWIHSPVWVDMIPYYLGGGSLGGIAIYCGKVLSRLDRVEEDIRSIDGKVNAIVVDTASIKSTVGAHDKQITGLEQNVYRNPPKEQKK